jgi:hypothetical protein
MRSKNGGDGGTGVCMRQGTTSRVTAADRPYGEFYGLYSVSPENFGSTHVPINSNSIISCSWSDVERFKMAAWLERSMQDGSGRAVYGRSPTWIEGSNPAGGMTVCLFFECCVFSGRCLFVDPIARPEESYRVWCILSVISKRP